jgi:hypothetical protein
MENCGASYSMRKLIIYLFGIPMFLLGLPILLLGGAYYLLDKGMNFGVDCANEINDDFWKVVARFKK